MIPSLFFITDLILAVLLLLIVYMTVSHQRLRKQYIMQRRAMARACSNFRAYRDRLLQAHLTLQVQLEGAEAAWGEADAAAQYKDKEIAALCKQYKELEKANELLIDRLHVMGNDYMQLKNDFANLNTKTDPHAFPM